MANIRIKNLPADATPNKNDLVPLDNATTRAATIEVLVNVGRPFASQAEAEAGVIATKAMNPLTTKQALAAQGALIFQPFSPVLSATTASFTTLDETKLDGVEEGADVTDAANVAAAGAVMASDTSTAPMGFVIDEDDMVSNSDTKVPTQQSVKAYVAANAGGGGTAPATRAALKALDTTSVTSAYLTEAGRDGQFLWRAGDYSTRVAADPLEGVYIKANAVAASSGAWVRQAGFLVTGLLASWFGAAPGAAMAANTAGIQAALNLALTIGAGKAKVGGGEYLLGYTSETFGSTHSPNPFHYGLMVPTGIILEGEGRATVLKRGTVTAMAVVIVPFGNGSQVRNLRIDGNATTYPIAGATYGSGGALWVESGSAGEDRDTILDTIWIEDTPGYGIGATWGNHRGLTMRNIFINGTGSDGIDIKRMSSGTFDAYGIVLDNIHIEDFGKTATDGAQAGLDIRGYVTASNIHVRKFGAKARAGIRLRGGITTDLVLGAHRSTLTNYRVERISGGEATTFGLEVNPDNVVTSNGMLHGCTINLGHVVVGLATDAVDISHVNVQSFNESLYGFRTEANVRGVRFIGCSATNVTGTGFRIEGDDNKLIAPLIRGVGAAAIGIDITATASNTSVIEPTYIGTLATTLRSTGTITSVLDGPSFGSGPKTGFAVDSTVGDSWVTATSLAGGAALVATSALADADIILSTKGAGYHAFGGTKTATTVGAAGGASALPATPTGYMRVKIGGTIRKIPYYAD